MGSATSCFNSTLYRKTMTRFWPLWALYGVIWAFLIPLNLLNQFFWLQERYQGELDLQSMLTSAALDIPYEAHILSAHRTPTQAAEFAKSARERGFGVVICAAGMAAHLAGAFAANTTLPVIGIPMKGGVLDGLDALLATVQMPGGIPVATVALNGAKNAAVLAAQILAVEDEALTRRLEAERRKMAEQIAEKDAKLQEELLKS